MTAMGSGFSRSDRNSVSIGGHFGGTSSAGGLAGALGKCLAFLGALGRSF